MATRGARETVFGVGAVVLALAAVGCGDDGPQWESYTDSTGKWTVDAPGEMEVTTQSASGLDVTIEAAELGSDYYAISTIPIPAGSQSDLDGAVEGATSSALASVESQLGTSGKLGKVDVETGSVAGEESREFSARIKADDVDVTIQGIVADVDDQLLQVLAVDSGGDDPDVSQHFVDSLEPA